VLRAYSVQVTQRSSMHVRITGNASIALSLPNPAHRAKSNRPGTSTADLLHGMTDETKHCANSIKPQTVGAPRCAQKAGTMFGIDGIIARNKSTKADIEGGSFTLTTDGIRVPIFTGVAGAQIDSILYAHSLADLQREDALDEAREVQRYLDTLEDEG